MNCYPTSKTLTRSYSKKSPFSIAHRYEFQVEQSKSYCGDYDIPTEKEGWNFNTKFKDIETIPITNALTVNQLFTALAKKWKNETAGYSFAAKKIKNIYYLAIIGLAATNRDVILKMILKDLEDGPDYWHFALKNITKQNPVDREHINDLLKIREAWLEWGRQNKLI